MPFARVLDTPELFLCREATCGLLVGQFMPSSLLCSLFFSRDSAWLARAPLYFFVCKNPLKRLFLRFATTVSSESFSRTPLLYELYLLCRCNPHIHIHICIYVYRKIFILTMYARSLSLFQDEREQWDKCRDSLVLVSRGGLYAPHSSYSFSLFARRRSETARELARIAAAPVKRDIERDSLPLSPLYSSRPLEISNLKANSINLFARGKRKERKRESRVRELQIKETAPETPHHIHTSTSIIIYTSFFSTLCFSAVRYENVPKETGTMAFCRISFFTAQQKARVLTIGIKSLFILLLHLIILTLSSNYYRPINNVLIWTLVDHGSMKFVQLI